MKIEVNKRRKKNADIIVRLYEGESKETKGQLNLLGNKFDFEIYEYEIKTFSLS